MRILFSAFQCLYFWKFPSHCLQISTYLSRNITLQISAILMNENWNAFAQEWNLLNKLEIQNEFSKTSLFWVSHYVKNHTAVISLKCLYFWKEQPFFSISNTKRVHENLKSWKMRHRNKVMFFGYGLKISKDAIFWVILVGCSAELKVFSFNPRFTVRP